MSLTPSGVSYRTNFYINDKHALYVDRNKNETFTLSTIVIDIYFGTGSASGNNVSMQVSLHIDNGCDVWHKYTIPAGSTITITKV